MPIPRILFALPVLLVGMLAPTAGAALHRAPADTVGMAHEGFTRTAVTVHRGDTLTLVNDSRFVHTIGSGQGGTITDAANVPVTGKHLMQSNNTLTTGRWNTTGTYYLTCSVHPEMTVKVVVTG